MATKDTLQLWQPGVVPSYILPQFTQFVAPNHAEVREPEDCLHTRTRFTGSEWQLNMRTGIQVKFVNPVIFTV